LWGTLVGLLSTPLTVLLFGRDFLGAAVCLKVLALASIVLTFNHVTNYLMLIFGWQARHALHEVLCLLVALPLYVTLIGRYGAVGASWTVLAAESSLFLMTIGYLARRWPERRNAADAAATLSV
jgi:O-antigen/teichoic acid export membrane protein